MSGEVVKLKIRNLKYKLFITLAVLLYAVLLYLSPVSCPILAITGKKCPGCGMTRAIISAFSLDFRAAFSHHLMFWSLPLLYLAFLYDGRLFKTRLANILFYSLIVIGFLINMTSVV